MQQSSRPLTHHQRPLLSTSTAAGPPARQSHSRASSHSLLTGFVNASHRITRRKSVTNPGPNVAVLTAAVAHGEQPDAPPINNSAARRHILTKPNQPPVVGCLPSPPASLPLHKSIPDARDSAIDDDFNEASGEEALDIASVSRPRRASEGQPLAKDKKLSRVEVRCQKCGKGYKHSSCLTKHLWEHTPEWSYTSKLLISKHQQVQLLEAASVLVAMNGKENPPTPPDSTKDSASELDSTSSAASGFSDKGERQSSADTTPPPTAESPSRESLPVGKYCHYQGCPPPASSESLPISEAVSIRPRHHRRKSSPEVRPISPGANKTGQEDRDLAAAVELLSCSFGSNNGSVGTVVTLSADAPPVPPVPVQFLGQASSLTSAGFINSFPSRQPESFTRGEIRCGSVDVKMEDSGDSGLDDDDFDMRCRARSDEEDEGVFGRMEE